MGRPGVHRVVEIDGCGGQRYPAVAALATARDRGLFGVVGAHDSANRPDEERCDLGVAGYRRFRPISGPVGGEESMARTVVGVEFVFLAVRGEQPVEFGDVGGRWVGVVIA